MPFYKYKTTKHQKMLTESSDDDRDTCEVALPLSNSNTFGSSDQQITYADKIPSVIHTPLYGPTGYKTRSLSSVITDPTLVPPYSPHIQIFDNRYDDMSSFQAINERLADADDRQMLGKLKCTVLSLIEYIGLTARLTARDMQSVGHVVQDEYLELCFISGNAAFAINSIEKLRNVANHFCHLRTQLSVLKIMCDKAPTYCFTPAQTILFFYDYLKNKDQLCPSHH